MGKRIKGILFDFGETIIDFGRVDLPALFKRGTELAYEYLTAGGHRLPPFKKYLHTQLRAVRWNIFKSRITRSEFNALDVIRRISDGQGLQLDHEHVIELAALWYEPLRQCASVEPGVREMLQQFRRDDLTLGVISNTFVPGHVLDRHLAQEHLLELLPVRIYSCDVKYRKPDPRIFQIALETAHLTPQQAIFVGDSLWADIRGANRAGLTSVLKDPLGRHQDKRIKPHHRIRSLLELPDIVLDYNDQPTEQCKPR